MVSKPGTDFWFQDSGEELMSDAKDEVEVEDAEPDFLDRLIEVVPIEQPKAAETPKKDAGSDDMDFFS